MFGWNVIMIWFMLRLQLGLMSLGCFVIDEILALITVGKIRFKVTHFFREGNVCGDKLANLGFIHRESFHWYNRLPSSLFLELFMNKYNLSMYHFC